MKNIQIYQADKYSTTAYTKVEENIYRGRNPYYNGNVWEQDELYVTSLTFEQEPELGEGDLPTHISKYPLEGILDMFYASVTDFYEELNARSKDTCYREFGAFEVEDIRKLLGIVGKHVYQKKVYAKNLSEEELESYKDMTEEEMVKKRFISYKTVIE
ncbi:MAG: hypothetical protein K2N95_02285 [Lachnospiraceae bacterium]|nr:hypothetical protein [Lachnospiraceae bacterium]